MPIKADVLIVTATKVELTAILSVLSPEQKAEPRPIGDRIYFDLGRLNSRRTPWWARNRGPRVFVTLSEMGAVTVGGALQTVQEGIKDLKPTFVIGAGIAFGMNEGHQSIGDVLVSTQLFLYEPTRIGIGPAGPKATPRGDIPRASGRLINLMRLADARWNGDAKVHFGLILTGEKLVDNLEFRDRLGGERDAIGGDMEAAGIYAACHVKNVNWILVKAICDWADGNKSRDKESRQRLAATNAAQFVLHALQFAPLKFMIWRLGTLARWTLIPMVVIAFWLTYFYATRAPSPYVKQRWSWAGTGTPDKSGWRFPGSNWKIESRSDKPVLLINGPAWQAGWPYEFDQETLHDFLFRFTVQFPDEANAEGTKLVWMIRRQKRGPGYWIAQLFRATDVDSIASYQFFLNKDKDDLFVFGRVVRRSFSEPVPLDDKPLRLGLHCCVSSTEYEVAVRVYQGHLDNCISNKSQTDLTTGRPEDAEAGSVGAAYFQDVTHSIAWGSVGFASGDAARRVIVRDIQVINLRPEFKSDLPNDPLRKYYSKDFSCQ